MGDDGGKLLKPTDHRNGWYYRILSPKNPRRAEYAFEEDTGAGPFATREEAIAARRADIEPGRLVVGRCAIELDYPSCPFSANDLVDNAQNDDLTDAANENWHDNVSDADIDDLDERLEALWLKWIDERGLRVEVCRFSQIEDVTDV